MGSADERSLRLHSVEFGTHLLRPGGAIRLGRHRDNDVVMNDPMVSRFHARITWERKEERPVVYDNGSQNGTLVDGERVRDREPLRDEARVVIGPFSLKVELVGVGETPAVLKKTTDMVTLFTDDGPELHGKVTPEYPMRQLMQRLEAERRTGTLRLKLKTGPATVTYCLGRVMWAEMPDGKGLRALEKILQINGGGFLFTRELEPREESLNMWISDFIRQLNHRAEATQPFRCPEGKR